MACVEDECKKHVGSVMKKRKNASGVEGLVHQNASSKNKKCTKSKQKRKCRKKPCAATARNFVKRGQHPYKFKSEEFGQYEPGTLPFPHVYSTNGIPSYDHGAHAYPSHGLGSHFPLLDVGVPGPSYGVEVEPPGHHGVEVPAPMCNDVGSPGLLPHSVSALCPLSHDIVAHGLASQGLGATSLHLKFPVVFLRGLPINCRETDIIRFFDGLDVVDVFLVFTAKRFSGDAFVVFSSPTFADFAIQRDKKKLGNVSVQILACSKQDYYNTVALAVTGVDYKSLQARAESLSNKTLLEHAHDLKSIVVAGAVAGSKVHERPENEAKSLLIKDHAGNKKIINDEANILINKDHPVLRVHGPPYFADMKVVVGVFKECDLIEDMIHIVLHPDGKPTGELFLEFMSLDGAKKAMSKDKTMIGSFLLRILPATTEDYKLKIQN